MGSDDPDERDSRNRVQETVVTESDDGTIEISISEDVAMSAGIGGGESVSIESDPVAEALIIRGRPICEWCGMWIGETGDTCPARDDGVACDPNPVEWYNDVLGGE